MATNDKEVVAATNNDVAQYIPFGGQDIGLGDEAVMPLPEFPMLQYATGLSASRPKLDAEGKVLHDEDTGDEICDQFNYSGFFTPYGVDKALDEAMLKLEAQTITINHNGGPAKHWMMNKVTVFPLAKGVPNRAGGNGDYGMTFLWREEKEGARRTVFSAQVMIRPLIPLNYLRPFVLTFKSTQTTDAITAFSKQYKVLQRVHEELRRVNKDMPLPLWAYSMVLMASPKLDPRGSGNGQKSIYPMISAVPENIDAKYLMRHEMPIEFADVLKDATDKAVEWSMALTQRIVSGAEPHEPWQQEPASPTNEAPF